MARVTLKDVAEHAGVDVSTVSRALSEDRAHLVKQGTRVRVMQLAEQLGYRGNLQASALRRGRTQTIGVVVADLSNPFIGPVLRGISQGLDGRRLLPIMTESRDDSETLGRVCDLLLAQRVDGVICTAGRTGDRAALKQLSKETPTVLAVRRWANTKVTNVSFDDFEGGRMAAKHLLSLGHTQVAQLVGPADIGSFEDRTRGFAEEISRAGGVCIEIEGDLNLPTFDAGRNLMTRLFQSAGNDMPTAVFAQNDSMAVGALHLASERGLRCPDDISIVGYNDAPLTAHLTPALTTVRLPGYEAGRVAAEMVVSLIEEPDQTPSSMMLAPDLIVRESTRTLHP
ncbi:MAG: LacI family DNA-binding transcriptional regulator [Acidimicrobiia bacterium]|nr:LacI family DNA-binding transcriptional regulator [Acidimicrobiia bacterium]